MEPGTRQPTSVKEKIWRFHARQIKLSRSFEQILEDFQLPSVTSMAPLIWVSTACPLLATGSWRKSKFLKFSICYQLVFSCPNVCYGFYQFANRDFGLLQPLTPPEHTDLVAGEESFCQFKPPNYDGSSIMARVGNLGIFLLWLGPLKNSSRLPCFSWADCYHQDWCFLLHKHWIQFFLDSKPKLAGKFLSSICRIEWLDRWDGCQYR